MAIVFYCGIRLKYVEQMDMNKAIFLDRDGTINIECRSKSNPKGFMWNMKDLYLIPGSIFGIALLNEMGYKTIVITNQSAVGRGIVTEGFVDDVHKEIDKRIARGNAVIDGYYYCPHHSTEAIGKYKKVCFCRKPAPGMVFSAAKKYNICLADSYFIGDGVRDIECAWNAGVRPILVLTGNGEQTLASFSEKERNKIVVVQDLLDAAQWLYNNK